MYQFARKIHLWIGLILAAVILIEAVTGFILSEPWIVGQDFSQKPPPAQSLSEQRGDIAKEGARPVQSGIFGIAKGLHQGKVGNFDLGWIVDLSAIGLVLLTLTGIYLAIPILSAKKHQQSQHK